MQPQDLAPEDIIWISAMMNKRPRSENETYVHVWLPPGQRKEMDSEDKVWIRMREQEVRGIWLLY